MKSPMLTKIEASYLIKGGLFISHRAPAKLLNTVFKTGGGFIPPFLIHTTLQRYDGHFSIVIDSIIISPS
jgi:hypothetical protein